MSLWRHRDFRRFWSAQGVSEFGDRVTELALPLIAVTVLHASPTEVGLLTAAVWAPNVAGFLIGTWVDRQRRKPRVMIAADLFRAVVLLSLPAGYWLGVVTLLQLYAVAVLTGAAKVVFDTAYPSFFVRLVQREEYLEANGKLSSTRSISFIAGPAVGGALVQVLTAPVAVLVDAVSFCFSAFQVSRVRASDARSEEQQQDPAGSLLGQAREGMSYVLRHPYLKFGLGCATTVNFFNFLGSALLVLFASRQLGLSAGVIGLAFGIGASGGLIGAVSANGLTRRFGVGVLIAFGAVVFPGSIAVAATASGPLWWRATALAIAEFIGGFAVMCFDVPLNSLQTAVTSNSMRSRVTGAFSTINYGIRPLGAVIGGVLGSAIGVRETLLVSAAGGLLAVLWLVVSPILRVRDLAEVEPPAEREPAA